MISREMMMTMIILMMMMMMMMMIKRRQGRMTRREMRIKKHKYLSK